MIRFIKKLFNRLPAFSNVAEGVHPGSITRALESAVSTRNLVGKQGSAANKIAPCGASDLPLGMITDTGEADDIVNVSLLSNSPSTVLMVASEAISAGDNVYTASNGQVQDQPASAGVYYHVGQALTAAAGNGSVFEAIPMTPRKVVVMEGFTGTPATDLSSLASAFEAAPDKIIMIPSE